MTRIIRHYKSTEIPAPGGMGDPTYDISAIDIDDIKTSSFTLSLDGGLANGQFSIAKKFFDYYQFRNGERIDFFYNENIPWYSGYLEDGFHSLSGDNLEIRITGWKSRLQKYRPLADLALENPLYDAEFIEFGTDALYNSITTVKQMVIWLCDNCIILKDEFTYDAADIDDAAFEIDRFRINRNQDVCDILNQLSLLATGSTGDTYCWGIKIEAAVPPDTIPQLKFYFKNRETLKATVSGTYDIGDTVIDMGRSYAGNVINDLTIVGGFTEQGPILCRRFINDSSIAKYGIQQRIIYSKSVVTRKIAEGLRDGVWAKYAEPTDESNPRYEGVQTLLETAVCPFPWLGAYQLSDKTGLLDVADCLENVEINFDEPMTASFSLGGAITDDLKELLNEVNESSLDGNIDSLITDIIPESDEIINDDVDSFPWNTPLSGTPSIKIGGENATPIRYNDDGTEHLVRFDPDHFYRDGELLQPSLNIGENDTKVKWKDPDDSTVKEVDLDPKGFNVNTAGELMPAVVMEDSTSDTVVIWNGEEKTLDPDGFIENPSDPTKIIPNSAGSPGNATVLMRGQVMNWASTSMHPETAENFEIFIEVYNDGIALDSDELKLDYRHEQDDGTILTGTISPLTRTGTYGKVERWKSPVISFDAAGKLGLRFYTKSSLFEYPEISRYLYLRVGGISDGSGSGESSWLEHVHDIFLIRSGY